MYTYQDLQELGDNEEQRIDFVKRCITEHKGTELFRTAVLADEYCKHRNHTIMAYRKLLYTVTGEAVPDNYSANYKLCSNFFDYFITQETEFLLGNGASWTKTDTEGKLGDDFDTRLQEIAKSALKNGIAFGFFNYDHLEVFEVTEFAPLYDEENGALMAGIRFWQVSEDKPLRATLYEIDGLTDYMWKDGKATVIRPKHPYIQKAHSSVVDGTYIYDGENYETFPIVPIWGNPQHQSELVGLQTEIDAYDLIKSGFANDVDDASEIYWTLENAGGMDDVDLAKFVQRMKTVKAAVMDEDGAKAEAHTMDIPANARETILTRIRKDMFADACALDTQTISGGAVTATQIKAAYEPLNNKTDQFEFCVRDFIDGILAIAGIDDSPVFQRSMLINAQEEVQITLQAAQYLPEEYVTRRILTIFGDGDQADEIIAKMKDDEAQRQSAALNDAVERLQSQEPEEPEEPTEPAEE